MGRKRGQPYRHGRKVCIFCEGTPTTKEHLWPAWAHSILPPSPMYSRNHLFGHPLKPETQKGGSNLRPGSVFDLAVERVCGPCNSGWMSRAETEIRPILEPMMKGEELELREADRAKLANYITYKFLIADWERRKPMIAPEIAQAFHATGAMPPRFTIDVFNCVEGSWRIQMLQTEVALYPTADFPEPEALPNTKSLALGFGNAFFLVTYTTSADFDLEISDQSSIPIWPPTPGTSIWPPEISISSEEADVTARIFRNLMSEPGIELIDPPASRLLDL